MLYLNINIPYNVYIYILYIFQLLCYAIFTPLRQVLHSNGTYRLKVGSIAVGRHVQAPYSVVLRDFIRSHVLPRYDQLYGTSTARSCVSAYHPLFFNFCFTVNINTVYYIYIGFITWAPITII